MNIEIDFNKYDFSNCKRGSASYCVLALVFTDKLQLFNNKLEQEFVKVKVFKLDFNKYVLCLQNEQHEVVYALPEDLNLVVTEYDLYGYFNIPKPKTYILKQLENY